MNRTILTILALLSSISNQSASAVEFHSPRTLGLGGAGRATPLLNDTIYLNPSYASFSPVYSLSGSYTSVKPNGRNYNVSVQDSRTELFQGGIGYTKREGDGVVSIGASRRAVDQLGIGLGSKFIINDTTRKMKSDMIFSTTYIPFSWINGTLVIDNLLGNFDRTIYLGTKFIPTQNVNIYFDPFYSPDYSSGNKAGYHLGVEFGLLADFFLRFGKYQDAEIPYLKTRGNGFGISVGWIGPKINFDFALSRALQTNENDSMISVNSFSTTVFF
jgi:hypothetical protein